MFILFLAASPSLLTAKCLAEVSVKKKGFVLVHALRVLSPARKVLLNDTAGHVAFGVRTQGEMNFAAHLTFSFLFTLGPQPWVHSLGRSHLNHTFVD